MGNSSSQTNRTPKRQFISLAEKGDINSAIKILNKFPDQKYEILNYSLNPLKRAATKGHKKFVEFLLSQDMINGELQRDAVEWSMSLNIDMALIILKADKNKNISFSNTGSLSAAKWAYKCKFPSNVNLFLQLILRGCDTEEDDLSVVTLNDDVDLVITYRLVSDKKWNYYKEFASRGKNPRLAELILMPIEELKKTPEAIACKEKFPEIMQIRGNAYETDVECKEELSISVADIGIFSMNPKKNGVREVGLDDFVLPANSP